MRRMYSENQLDSIIKEQVEGGTLENAKPIYYHPIYISGIDYTLRLTAAILDNNPTPYTLATFKAKVQELCDADAIINANGLFMLEGVCYNIFIISKTGPSYAIYGADYQGNRTYIDLLSISAINSFDDGVNKIN